MKIDVAAIREALRKFNRRAGVLKSDPYGIGLSLSQSSALVDIGRFGRLKSNDLVRLLRLDKSSVSRMVDVLIEKKLISVSDDSADGRSKILTLTASGKKVVLTINDLSDKSVTDVLKNLDLKDQRALAVAFESLGIAVDVADRASSSHPEQLA